MKSWFLGAVSVALTSVSALAADMPMYRPPPRYIPPPVISWTGFYMGVNAGYSWGISSFIKPSQSIDMLSVGPPVEAEMAVVSATAAGQWLSAPANGFVGGAQIGYNWQASDTLVIGAEADAMGFANTKESRQSLALLDVPTSGGMQIASFTEGSRSLNFLGTVRGRIGYLAWPTVMIYGTAGLAYGNVSGNFGIQQSLSTPGVELNALPGVVPTPFTPSAWNGQSSYRTMRVGYTAGMGFEWMFMPGVSLKGEYLYYSLGTVTTPAVNMQVQTNPALAPIFANTFRATTKYDGHVLRAGVNIHFGDYGTVAAPIVNTPVVARY